VLGLAALVASIARPPEDDGDTAPPAQGRGAASAGPPTASPRPGSEPLTIAMRAGGRRDVRRLPVGRPATLVVSVGAPGQVAIPSLGLVQPAEPLTPARFDVLASSAGRHRIELTPASPDAGESVVGTLRVVSQQSSEH
jgi:hypothetical protein